MTCSAQTCTAFPALQFCPRSLCSCPSVITIVTSTSLNLASFCLSWLTCACSCWLFCWTFYISTVLLLISLTSWSRSWITAKASFLSLLFSDSQPISLSWKDNAYFRLWSKSWISFCVWLTLSTSFFSRPWYCDSRLSNLWNTSFRLWISFIFSTMSPLIRSIYFVIHASFSLYALISS